jgi:hypothetical protein
LDKVIEVFSDFGKITSVNDKTAVLAASFIVRNGWNKDIIFNYYRKVMRAANDVRSWKIETHKAAIKKLLTDGIECDGKRMFTDEDKSNLYEKTQKCAVMDCTVHNYKDLEIVRITPWSVGGKTSLDNARLYCRAHNASRPDADGQRS